MNKSSVVFSMNLRTLLLAGLLTSLMLAGCLDDAETDPQVTGNPPGPWVGALNTTAPEVLTGLEMVTQTLLDGEPLGPADGVWIHNDMAYLSGPPGLRIVDIRDPANPVVLHEGVEDTSSRDVDILEHPDGRTYAVLTSGGVKLVDVTDPTTAHVVSVAAISSHNMAVVPNTTIVYNSISINTDLAGEAGGLGKIDIVDFADPEHPEVHEFWFPAVIQTRAGVPRAVASTTCHDITFNEDRQRAYCAGVTDTQIWDISTPLQPTIIQVIDYPLVNIHHGVWDARDGDLLILGDEFAGAAAGPMCSSTMQYPTSALWFFDISDIETPTPVDYFQVEWDSISGESQNTALCTTHFGTLVAGHEAMVMGWYSAGSVLVDFGGVQFDPDFGGARQIDHFRPDGDVNTWEAREYKGHIFTGDTQRGMDILRII